MLVGKEVLTCQMLGIRLWEQCLMRTDGGLQEVSCHESNMCWLQQVSVNSSNLSCIFFSCQTGFKFSCDNITNICSSIYSNATWVYHADTGTFETYKDIPYTFTDHLCMAKIHPNKVFMNRNNGDTYLFDITTEQFTKIASPRKEYRGMYRVFSLNWDEKGKAIKVQNGKLNVSGIGWYYFLCQAGLCLVYLWNRLIAQ